MDLTGRAHEPLRAAARHAHTWRHCCHYPRLAHPTSSQRAATVASWLDPEWRKTQLKFRDLQEWFIERNRSQRPGGGAPRRLAKSLRDEPFRVTRNQDPDS